MARARRLATRLRIVRPRRANTGAPQPPVSLAFVVRDNLRQRRSIERVYMEAIQHARHRIDLVTPYFCVSCNLSRAETVVHDRGLLWLWSRASSSVPGIGPPVPFHGDLLVDGGVLLS